MFEECKKPQTVATSEAFFQYSFDTQIQKKSFIQKRNVLNTEENVLIQKQTFVLCTPEGPEQV